MPGLIKSGSLIRMKAEGDSERSLPHRRVERVLESMRVNYLSEQPFRPYKVDIYLPEWHLVIEVDGPFHNAAADRRRDNALFRNYGLETLRINGKKWIKTSTIEELILEFIDKHAESVDTRRSVGRVVSE